jgi:hypothetical protein
MIKQRHREVKVLPKVTQLVTSRAKIEQVCVSISTLLRV